MGQPNDFRRFLEVFSVFVTSQGVKSVGGGGARSQNGPKHPILTAVCHRGVNIAWWVHVGMTNSLVVLNLLIWEILILFVTSKGEGGGGGGDIIISFIFMQMKFSHSS